MSLTTVQAQMIGGSSSGAFAPNTSIYQNLQTLSVNTTIPTGSNGFAAGPFTVATGVVLTTATGSRFVVV
jgi:hypothetical protein